MLCLQEVRFETDGASLQLKTIAAETGLTVVSARPQHGRKDGGLSGNAVLSALRVIAAGSIDLGTPGCQRNLADYAVVEAPPGQALVVVSAHLAWGGDKKRTRLAQMTAVDGHLRELMDRYQDRDPIAVLAGDFNTLDQRHNPLPWRAGCRCRRRLHLLDRGVRRGRESGGSCHGGIRHTGRSRRPGGVGIEFPELLPDRRIDYVWTYGWAYGRPGCPVAMQRSFTDTTRYGYPVSDHYGLTVDFWVPPVLAPVPAETGQLDAVPAEELMLELEAAQDNALV